MPIMCWLPAGPTQASTPTTGSTPDARPSSSPPSATSMRDSCSPTVSTRSRPTCARAAPAIRERARSPCRSRACARGARAPARPLALTESGANALTQSPAPTRNCRPLGCSRPPRQDIRAAVMSVPDGPPTAGSATRKTAPLSQTARAPGTRLRCYVRAAAFSSRHILGASLGSQLPPHPLPRPQAASITPPRAKRSERFPANFDLSSCTRRRSPRSPIGDLGPTRSAPAASRAS